VNAPPAPARWSVVVCAYTFERLRWTADCLHAVAKQPEQPEVFVIVDHNEPLRRELQARFPALRVMANEGVPGLGAGRNTGVRHATGQLVAFIDDDALPGPGWLAALGSAFDDPRVVGAGGHAVPAWEGKRPAWFPEEYLWVVGCSYRGMPVNGRIRNPIGCNMAFRRDVLVEVGGFGPTLGRLGNRPFGLEETELCVRLLRAQPGSLIAMVEGATVEHHVPRSRQGPGYFLQRCFYEGAGKALLRELTDGAALSSERSYALRTLPRALLRDGLDVVRLRAPHLRLARMAAVTGGLAAAVAGYAWGRVQGVRPS